MVVGLGVMRSERAKKRLAGQIILSAENSQNVPDLNYSGLFGIPDYKFGIPEQLIPEWPD